VIGLRAAAAGVFVLAILLAPRPAVASFVILFAAYIAADGLFAILAGARAARRGERWWILIAEGATNLAVAGGVLVWPAIAAAPFIHLASAWAIVTGALMLAVARRLVGSHGRWLLTLAGVVSAAWGAVATTIGPAFVTDASVGIFLVGYALLFGAVLSALTVRLRRRHREAQPGADAEPSEGASPRP